MYYSKFEVAPGKRFGWNNLMGQENPVNCVEDHCTINGASQFDSEHSGFLVGTVNAPCAPQNAAITSRKLGQILNGPQTPKATQPALELWVPLIFWFNVGPKK